jgi:hypothetical protein
MGRWRACWLGHRSAVDGATGILAGTGMRGAQRQLATPDREHRGTKSFFLLLFAVSHGATIRRERTHIMD